MTQRNGLAQVIGFFFPPLPVSSHAMTQQPQDEFDSSVTQAEDWMKTIQERLRINDNTKGPRSALEARLRDTEVKEGQFNIQFTSAVAVAVVMVKFTLGGPISGASDSIAKAGYAGSGVKSMLSHLVLLFVGPHTGAVSGLRSHGPCLQMTRNGPPGSSWW